MRLASEVKEKRRKPLRLLVNFLRIWYRPDVLPQLLAKAGTPSLRMHLQAAISQSRSSPDPRLKVLDAEIEKAKQENRLEDLLPVLEERAHTRGSAKDWFELAYYHAELKNFEAALDCYDKALEIDPQYAFAWNNKGNALNNLGRNEAALDCYNKALEIDPQVAFAWNGKGNVLDNLGRNEAALDCYNKALEIDPQYAVAWNGKGHALARLGRDEDAWECYERGLELDSTAPWWLFGRCEPRFGLRRWEAGFVALREAFERYPRDTAHDVKDILDLFLRLSEGREDLRRHLARLIAIYSEAGVLAHLGDGLVRSLRLIDAGRLGVKALEDWREAWLELGGGHSELEIPLRIFRVGIEYLIRGDEKVLLDLVTVERKVLRQALGLDGADGVESSHSAGSRPPVVIGPEDEQATDGATPESEPETGGPAPD
jgi:tetratricopeptide (TPR) repeat protein